MAVGGLDPDGGVVRDPSGDGPVGAVEVGGELGEFAVRVEVVPEARGDAGAGGLPCAAGQQLGTGVRPAPAGGRVDVTAP